MLVGRGASWGGWVLGGEVWDGRGMRMFGVNDLELIPSVEFGRC